MYGTCRRKYVYDCALESLEDTIGYKNIIQLSMDISSVNWKFSSMFEKNEETNFNHAVSTNWTMLSMKGSAVWIADFYFFLNYILAFYQSYWCGKHSPLFKFSSFSLMTVFQKVKHQMFFEVVCTVSNCVPIELFSFSIVEVVKKYWKWFLKKCEFPCFM